MNNRQLAYTYLNFPFHTQVEIMNSVSNGNFNWKDYPTKESRDREFFKYCGGTMNRLKKLKATVEKFKDK